MSNPNVPNKIYTDEVVAELVKKLQRYIEETDVPIVAEFAYKNNIPRQRLYDIPAFHELMQNLIAKKEANLEKGGLSGQLNPTITKFSLMQLGWKQKIENELTGKGGKPLFESYEMKLKGMSEAELEEENKRLERLLDEDSTGE